MMRLSIVTTLYKSAAFIPDFYRRCVAAAETICSDFEIVMVDDGSPDNSLHVACKIAERDPRVRVVELSRNFGHHKAMMAGLENAAGDFVFLLDSDLEEPPELLQDFYQRLERAGCDVVFGFQRTRKGTFLEKQGGRAAWWLMKKLYSIDLPANQSTVRLMRRDYVNALLLHRESNPVIGCLWVITGFRQLGVPFEKGHREGATYSFAGRAHALIDGVTSFSTAPLVFMVYAGIILSLASFVFGLFIVEQRLMHQMAVGWASLILSIWFVGGMIMFSLGILGIYISQIFIETKHRPYVIVRKIHHAAAD